MSPAHLARLLSRDPPRQGLLLFAGVWAVSAVLGYTLLYRRWIPHDAGDTGFIDLSADPSRRRP